MLPGQAIAAILLAFLPILLLLLFTDVVAVSFAKLGLPPIMVFLLFAAAVVGSVINIPLWERSAGFLPGGFYRVGRLLYYKPPTMSAQIIAVNVGGAIVPLLLSLWLLTRAAFWKVLLATAVMVLLSHAVARVQPGTGVVMPVFVPPLASAALAWVLARVRGSRLEAAPIAYISGSMGTLIGADLLNLGRLDALGPGVLSIGGAGVFDGVFLVGIVAVFLA